MTQLAFKQAILRETLERGGVKCRVKSLCSRLIRGAIVIASGWRLMLWETPATVVAVRMR